MKNKIRTVFHARCKVLLILAGVVLTITCNSCKDRPHFKSSGEAIEACHEALEKFRDTKDASTKVLAENIANWLELQDSAYAAFSRDTSVTLRSPIALAYFSTADSVRIELKRIAKARPRSLKDVMYLKLYTAKEYDKVHKSETWQEAVDFYKSLDKYDCYPSLPETIRRYEYLLSTTKQFKDENQFKKFIAREDVCFRSLMKYLSGVPQNRLKDLTAKTSIVFDKFYNIIGRKQDELDDKTMLLLTMRFNRRIIQNAEACRNDIKNNSKLDEAQRANYRWMLIQPYLTLDSFSAATLTDQQRNELLDLSNELPSLLTALDESEDDNKKAQEVTNVLSDYFLNSYISTTL